MPLLDHFTPPVPPRAGWRSFHHRWAGAIADRLDATLPPQFFARVEVNLGSEVAAGVAEYEEPTAAADPPPTFTPSVPTQTWAVTFPDEAAVEVRTTADGGRLVAVVELAALLGQTADPAPSYAAAYRPRGQVDVWWVELAVGRPLPVLPLALRGRGCLPLDLEGLYTETCRRARLAPLAVRDGSA
jgi:hypothetical protein